MREAVSELLPVEDPVGEEDPVDVRVDWADAKMPNNLTLG